MKLTEMLRIIWINILQNKFKVILSSLGIIVGVAHQVEKLVDKLKELMEVKTDV